jgi:hypothetical protein
LVNLTVPVNAIVVAHQIIRRGVKRKGFHDLLRSPLCGRIRRHVEVSDAPPTVFDDNEHLQDLESCRGYGKEINRGNGLGHLMAEFEQLTVDTRGARSVDFSTSNTCETLRCASGPRCRAVMRKDNCANPVRNARTCTKRFDRLWSHVNV